MCVCVCVCVSVPRKRFSGNCRSHHHGDCLRHENVSLFNHIDLDLRFKVTQILVMQIISVRLFQKLFKQCPPSLILISALEITTYR